jgi:predicted deacylase
VPTWRTRALAPFARAFGAELIVSGTGPEGSLRRSACAEGVPTLILEAGEVWKVEPGYVGYATRGIANCLRFLGMVAGRPEEPAYRVEADATSWIRADHGGFLEFHVAPGDVVEAGDPIATNTDLAGTRSTCSRPARRHRAGHDDDPLVSPG